MKYEVILCPYKNICKDANDIECLEYIHGTYRGCIYLNLFVKESLKDKDFKRLEDKFDKDGFYK